MENTYIHFDSGKNDIVENNVVVIDGNGSQHMEYDSTDAAKLQSYLDMTISPPYEFIEQVYPTEESLHQAHELQKEAARKLLGLDLPDRSDVEG